MPKTSWKLLTSGKQRKTTKYHLALGSYKDGLADNLYGWEVEKGFTPTTLGSWLIDIEGLNYYKDRETDPHNIEYKELN
jgi:hypothetical protein